MAGVCPRSRAWPGAIRVCARGSPGVGPTRLPSGLCVTSAPVLRHRGDRPLNSPVRGLRLGQLWGVGGPLALPPPPKVSEPKRGALLWLSYVQGAGPATPALWCKPTHVPWGSG